MISTPGFYKKCLVLQERLFQCDSEVKGDHLYQGYSQQGSRIMLMPAFGAAATVKALPCTRGVPCALPGSQVAAAGGMYPAA